MSLIKKIFNSGVIALVMSSTIHAQDFAEEFESLINTEKPTLLPEKMLISQRVLWGEKVF